MEKNTPLHVAVVGAGAFGSWTAYHLLQRGARVTLCDAWGPGHSRASSGGETRITRSVYGPHRLYVKMVAESFPIWREFEERWGETCYVRTGALWMFNVADEGYLKASLPHMQEFNLPIHRLDMEEARKRFPQIETEDLHAVWFEEEAGYLFARRSCQLVVEAFIKSGGDYRQLKVQPGDISSGRLDGLTLSDGSTLQADVYVFACGPWLLKLFPELLAQPLNVSRQEVYFFAPPPGHEFLPPNMPVWLEFGDPFFYGIPHPDGRGFKLADDDHTHTGFDPDGADRMPTPQRLEQARKFLAHRFPRLAQAPLIESRICQYTNSPDGHLVIDQHPEANNVWIAGAGTGHGFKLGPSIGKYLSSQILDGGPAEPDLRLDRLGKSQSVLYNQFAVRE